MGDSPVRKRVVVQELYRLERTEDIIHAHTYTGIQRVTYIAITYPCWQAVARFSIMLSYAYSCTLIFICGVIVTIRNYKLNVCVRIA